MTETLRTTLSGGDIVLPRVLVTDFAQCIQRQIIDGLSLWQGEWFLDQNAGFPWLQILGQKIQSTTQLSALLRQFLLSIPGIVSVQAQSTYNGAARSFSYAFTAYLNNGQTLTGGSSQPFVISGAP